MLFYLGSLLLVTIGIAHSYLGERYILIRLFRRGNLPELLGGQEFTKNTLRFAWHLTTLAWWGVAVILLFLAQGSASVAVIANTIGVIFLLHAVVSLLGSKGRHFSWIFFLSIGASVMYAANT